jgi:hypothetical protein
MQISSRLVIQDQKITQYLLIFQEKDDKSQFLANAGYTLQNWEQLKADILCFVPDSEILATVETPWGLRYRVRSQWQGANGRSIAVISIWQDDRDADVLRFVTLYPDKSIDRTLDVRG